ncbi:MAG: competence protein TfoX [Clostridia bacterium]|nr:competence protein TfoX [Clostridia bacterium]
MTTKEKYEFYSDAFSVLPGITFFPMMGEYVIKYKKKTVGGLYDDKLLIKITAASTDFLSEASRVTPYAGAKEMFSVENLPDPASLGRLFDAMYAELPYPKKRHKKFSENHVNLR